MFCGNPGAGKSALCNSIFQKPVFNSGISLGSGLITHKQEYLCDSKLYVDTPGLSDPIRREQAAKEIEAALKLNNKLVFIITLERGRIKSADITTINLICLALAKVNFEYGLIINEVSNKVFSQIKDKTIDEILEDLFPKNSIEKLHKRPSPASVIILKKIEALEDESNKYFESNSENREKLLKFLNDLPAYKIPGNKVGKIDVSIFDTK